MPEFVVPEPSEPFQSEQIYGWIDQLCVRSYEDLLAPHWNTRDRAVPTERFEPARFTRERAANGAAVPTALQGARRSIAHDTGATPPASLVAVRALPAASAPAPSVAIRPAPRGLIGRLRLALAEWHRRLLSWVMARGR
jgi:hypothetical protein